ncbi:MAG: hypothetical protein Ct9H300mP8_00610 [Gammaproteobacteria bacterium]|nr:MAG: hypothetical protein Ct9H300mP8_00610 [Gammaproteobacteria bacterium]
MTVSAGIGIANFNFDDTKGFWKWVDLCDSGGVDSIWQSDRIISPEANLECMSVMAALAGATKRIKFGMNVPSLGLRDPVLRAQAVRDNRRSFRGPGYCPLSASAAADRAIM